MMGKKPFGCLTTSGLITALLTLLIVIGIGLVQDGVLFSPGDLNAKTGAGLGGVTSHAGLSNRCSACHPAFWETATLADRCMACHTDIAAQQQDSSRLHGNLLKNNPGLTCRACHPDHRGANAPLTDLSKAKVFHNAFGYALSGHPRQADGSPFTCSACHGQDYTSFDKGTCTVCHVQIKATFMQSHIQAYGDNCLVCHDGIETYGPNFNHNNAAFQLTGKHAQVDCAGCHAGARSIADLRSTSQECFSCHARNDPHQGRFGNGCGACHTTSGWLPATFDHSRSKFPLTGAHGTVACAQCHKNSDFSGLSTACASCHADPLFHLGLFVGTSCDQCHNTTAWSPAIFNGAHPGGCGEGGCINHERAACRDCHTVNLATATCTKCHNSNNPGGGD